MSRNDTNGVCTAWYGVCSIHKYVCLILSFDATRNRIVAATMRQWRGRAHLEYCTMSRRSIGACVCVCEQHNGAGNVQLGRSSVYLNGCRMHRPHKAAASIIKTMLLAMRIVIESKSVGFPIKSLGSAYGARCYVWCVPPTHASRFCASWNCCCRSALVYSHPRTYV